MERQLAFFKVFSSLPSVRGLLSYYLNQYAFAPPAVEFTVENLFPGAEIQSAFRNCDDDFPAHDLTFEVCVSIVFAGSVVSISGGRRVRR